MNQENRNEIWQVEVGGQIYEAALTELPEWIGEGSLQPQDKVRKGNLRWIEARKVPALIPFFNARELGESMPVMQSVTDVVAGGTPPVHSVLNPSTEQVRNTDPLPRPAQTASFKSVDPIGSVASAPGFCRVHADISSAYVCSACGGEFCKHCPSSYGGSVRICPDCGSLCREAGQVAESDRRAAAAVAIGGDSFGISDLGRSFAYPFKFPASLILGALMFMVFSIGQAASSFGGIIFFGASVFCMMLANMLTFGVLFNTIENFTQGKLDSDFMPGFEDFSIWDDVIHPFFLSIGAYLAAFGPFILVAAIGAYLVISAAGEQLKKFNSELARVPGTHYYTPDNTGGQTQQVQEILDRAKASQERRIADQRKIMDELDSGRAPEEITGGPTYVSPEEERAAHQRVFDGSRQPESVQGATGPTLDPSSKYKEFVTGILRIAAPIVVIGAIALLWGLFFFPAACVVAGYSKSFIATVNPLVGLDTIRRLGGTYIKILLMGLVILTAAGFVTLVVQLLFLPFGLPGFGNLPATAVGSIFTFYFWVVFWCVLSFALFKKADHLNLYR